jgi:2-polyprenyl-3-methyl-5-hydroxy-6-metoxy-1,4-benzoquinol methylase
MHREPPLPIDAASNCCENCGFGPLEPHAAVKSPMWYCSQCGLYQKGRVASANEYNDDYCAARGYSSPGRRHRKLRTATVRLGRIARLVESDSPRSLDVGCSLGYSVEAACRFGWDAHGVDISRDAIRQCRIRGLRCRNVAGTDLPYPDGHFDVLTAWHVIEHVRDVAHTLAEWARVLRPGGVLALETPDSDCLKLKLRGGSYSRFWALGHTYTFNRRNLAPLVEAAGLAVISAPFLADPACLQAREFARAAAYQFLKEAQIFIGMHKAFQLFCRRHAFAEQTPALRRAA